MMNVKPLQFPRPYYPREALTKGMGGWAIVRYDVIDGKTQNVALLESSAVIFDAPSLAATRDMEFAPDVSLTQCVALFRFET